MSIVSQDMYIFDGTILQNVMYGSEHANMVDIIDACKKAAIYDFIKEQLNGFDTVVGNRGIKLSGGQCQRLALARIFLRDTDIVILDEATSALDNESESIIQESLSLFKGKTIISIAHRLTTIKDCDDIYYIDNHKVVEHGTHDNLMKKHGSYYNMVMSKS
jgi:ATP-binding cassette subfamily B protein